MTSTIGIPIKLLNEATGHQVTVEIDSGQTYRGKLVEAEDNMNCQLENINVTQRDGRVTHLDRVYIRGSHVEGYEGSWCRVGERQSNSQQGARPEGWEIDECGLEREST
ncbi:hypothetical protein KC334_g7404 [Hortaea werneckii]|nr:hypothetical protein KC334_g7404 [Hortaea werneckii]KAI7007701.1 hypothetical protein KC355_g7242 [Hortaea werneckii]